jgi:hypothetical protein
MAPAHEARCMCRLGSLDVQRAFDGGFPFGTLAVNVAGCMLFGAFVRTLAEERLVISEETARSCSSGSRARSPPSSLLGQPPHCWGNRRVNAAPTNLAERGRRLIARLRHPGRDVHAGG